MPLDPRIPLGALSNVQIQSPLNAMARIQAIRSSQANEQMNALQLRRFEAQDEQRNALMRTMADPSLSGPARFNALLGSGNIDAANAIRDRQETAEKTAADFTANVPKILANVPKEQRPAAYAALLSSRPNLDISLIPPQLTPEFDALIDAAGKPTQYQERQLGLNERRASAAEASARATAATAAAKPAPLTMEDRMKLKGLNPDATPIKGGPQDPDVIQRKQSVVLSAKDRDQREKAYPKATTAVKTATQTFDDSIADIDALVANKKGLEEITGYLAGRTDLAALSGDARRALALYKKIVARGGFKELVDMRNASPTGGALGNVSDTEGRYLREAFAALDRTQNAEDVEAVLNDLKGKVERSKGNIREAYDLTYEYRNPVQTEAAGAAKEYPADANTPEERAEYDRLMGRQ